MVNQPAYKSRLPLAHSSQSPFGFLDSLYIASIKARPAISYSGFLSIYASA